MDKQTGETTKKALKTGLTIIYSCIGSHRDDRRTDGQTSYRDAFLTDAS